jgi:HB1, ASXL, restriction endonuclease HTH domain
MSKKKNTAKTPVAPTADLPALKIGSRVRCTDDQVTGRIVWANAASVKVKWDDGEQVTWRRDSLAGRPVEIIDADEDASAAPAAEVAPEPEYKPMTDEELTYALDSIEAAHAGPPAPQATNGHTEAPADQPAAETATATAKPRRQRKAAAESKVKKLSALDAAAKVLAEEAKPMTCQEMIDAMAAKGYWSSPGGKTPAATLYSAILRELSKGADSRFVKTERGKFARKS